ncbi:hypothetical protein TEA_004813 [Camellia sinensis var. sinensis]|uniref:Uncharacterized protein n=1 Tax=Camellia sinensis var. sinensis TaxID=542762 RepID=A0A4S4E2S5_CAMSN|nr:hypothetical protein TEA_004813 [Camellia sinensis var. sinensis]
MNLFCGHVCIRKPMRSRQIGQLTNTLYVVAVEQYARAYKEALLSYITNGDDVQVFGSLSMLATLLQTKELEESMLDALGILPQRKQHKKLLLQALVGEGSGEEQLFSSESSSMKDGIASELDSYLQKLKDQYGLSCSCPEVGVSPRVHRFQVLDALVRLFCRSNISAETLWDGGWLFRQLLPYNEAQFNSRHLKLLKSLRVQCSYKNCTSDLLAEARGTWPDLLITFLCDEWRKCKRAIEASSPRREPKCSLFPSRKPSFEEPIPGELSFPAGERMCELVKIDREIDEDSDQIWAETKTMMQQCLRFSKGCKLPDLGGDNNSSVGDEDGGGSVAVVDES